MNQVKRSVMWSVVLCVLVIAGCSEGHGASVTSEENGPSWLEAKRSTQAREREIAESIPEPWVVETLQTPDGFLLDCGADEKTWNGLTEVTLAAEIDPVEAVNHVESRFDHTTFTMSTRLNVVGQHELQLIAPDGVENYIVAEGEPGVIRIASGSPCFALPEGTYPGGTW